MPHFLFARWFNATFFWARRSISRLWIDARCYGKCSRQDVFVADLFVDKWNSAGTLNYCWTTDHSDTTIIDVSIMTEMLTTLICQLIGLYIVYFVLKYHKLLITCMFFSNNSKEERLLEIKFCLWKILAMVNNKANWIKIMRFYAFYLLCIIFSFYVLFYYLILKSI